MYRKSKRGRTLVGKGGRITSNSKKNVDALIQKIKDNQDYSDAEKVTLINELKYTVEYYHQQNKKLTTSGFFAKFAEDKINRFLANAGYSAEELAAEAGVEVEDVLNEANWSGDYFMGVWKINFNYTGSIITHI